MFFRSVILFLALFCSLCGGLVYRLIISGVEDEIAYAHLAKPSREALPGLGHFARQGTSTEYVWREKGSEFFLHIESAHSTLVPGTSEEGEVSEVFHDFTGWLREESKRQGEIIYSFSGKRAIGYYASKALFAEGVDFHEKIEEQIVFQGFAKNLVISGESGSRAVQATDCEGITYTNGQQSMVLTAPTIHLKGHRLIANESHDEPVTLVFGSGDKLVAGEVEWDLPAQQGRLRGRIEPILFTWKMGKGTIMGNRGVVQMETPVLEREKKNRLSWLTLEEDIRLVHESGLTIHASALRWEEERCQIDAKGPITMTDTLGSLEAERATISYRKEKGRCIAEEVCLQGNVAIVNRYFDLATLGKESAQYILADEAIYSPEKRAMRISSIPPHRALLYSGNRQMEMSAEAFLIERDPFSKAEMIRGVGHVIFSLKESEWQAFRRRFPLFSSPILSMERRR